MKTRISLILSTFTLAFLTLGAMQAQAIIIYDHPVGITFGQTARVNVSNTSDRAIIIIGGKFFDSDGNILAEFGRQVIEPGKIMSFDLNGDDIAIVSRSGASLKARNRISEELSSAWRCLITRMARRLSSSLVQNTDEAHARLRLGSLTAWPVNVVKAT
jgi:hypothetical protein